MYKKKFVKIFFIFTSILFVYFIFSKEDDNKLTEDRSNSETYNSNIIKDIKYKAKDANGNEYIINATEAEIDFSNPNILFLKKVDALIKLNNSEQISIVSDYGKYNSENFDTIFSKNVIIDYQENKITSEYLDFSLKKNFMIISKNVIYKNLKNILKADVVEMNIQTKDTKIFRYEEDKKVNIKNKN